MSIDLKNAFSVSLQGGQILYYIHGFNPQTKADNGQEDDNDNGAEVKPNPKLFFHELEILNDFILAWDTGDDGSKPVAVLLVRNSMHSDSPSNAFNHTWVNVSTAEQWAMSPPQPGANVHVYFIEGDAQRGSMDIGCGVFVYSVINQTPWFIHRSRKPRQTTSAYSEMNSDEGLFLALSLKRL